MSYLGLEKRIFISRKLSFSDHQLVAVWCQCPYRWKCGDDKYIVLSFEMKNTHPETLFFFFNVLAILGLMYFHVNFELVNFRKKKKSQLEF